MTGNTTGSANGSVLAHQGAVMNLAGSILYNPGMVGRTTGSSGQIVYSGCLLVDSAANWPLPPNAPRVGNPILSANLAPPMNSPAIDVCGSGSAPATDFHGRTRSVDQTAVGNVYGPVDLGAIELPFDDTIFANGFE